MYIPGDLGRVADVVKLFFLGKCKIIETIMHLNANEFE